MGFKVVISGATESFIAKRLVALAEDQPWNILLCGSDFTAESVASVESFFELKQPSIVVNLMPEPTDHLPVSSLRNLASVCASRDIPLLHQSSYWAIAPDDPRAEVQESVLADAASETNQFARDELMVSTVPRHIILRSSWILDGASAGLFAHLLPLLIGPEPRDFVVSDHDFGAPVSCSHISDVIVAIVQQILTGADNWGTYHLHSADACSEAEFCDHLVRQLQKELNIDLVFPNVAAQDDERRFMNLNANLVGRKITDDFGIQAPTWRRGFGRTLRSWLKKHAKELELEGI